MNYEHLQWWNNLRHGGLLLDIQRLGELVPSPPDPLDGYTQDRLRREISTFTQDHGDRRGRFVGFVLQNICGLALPHGDWYRAGNVSSKWTRRAITGEAVRPSHLWLGQNGATLPVFIDDEKRIGVGRGKRTVSRVLQWLRRGDEQLAVVTNGFQWRLVFAGLDYDAFCEWDIGQWFLEGAPSEEFNGLRALLSPQLWTPPAGGEPCPLLAGVNESRKGQADLSQVLGERVRQAAELLIQTHAPALNYYRDRIDAQDIYRAGVHFIMRMVVVLFAESREGLLPRDNPIYHSAYSLQGLREQLSRISPHRLAASYQAYPRILSLFRLIHQGSTHQAIPVPSYGGELFAVGDAADPDGMKQALHVLETACFGQDLMNDYQVHQILDLLTRTEVRIRQGRTSFRVSAPVDFSRLGSEYIGILYEGLLDFELRTALDDQPIVFLAVGNQPALPLATLEGMSDRAIKDLLEKLAKEAKKKSPSAEGDSDEEDEEDEDADEERIDEDAADAGPSDDAETEEEPDEVEGAEEPLPPDDPRHTTRARAEGWARKACEVGKLVSKPRGRMTPEKRMQHEQAVERKARQLVVRVVLPGEWYLVRWGGTRKGSGTFYTRPQLAIPTAHRTLMPLAYDPPAGEGGEPDRDAPVEAWTPKKPEEILSLKVCDPACGSGSFCLAALRFLTEALYRSLQAHGRIRDYAGESVLELIYDQEGQELLADEKLPCGSNDDRFEDRTKAVLRRYVAERCIYGVDISPLAIQLARLSLWIETMDRSLPMTFLDHKIKPGNSLVGAWFDQFLHYPAMAWQRQGGDKSHTNGVHYTKGFWTKAIKEFSKAATADLKHLIDTTTLLYAGDLSAVRTAHDAAEAALKEIHSLGIAQVDQRAARYEALRADPAFRGLQDAFDLWCALWFWPADELDKAPLPSAFAAGEIGDDAHAVARHIAAERRFFHWELEFPDVFNATCGGFDAVLGNPPWETLQPVSKEFFSAFDPLYRSYGKQEAVGKQKEYFQRDAAVEDQWLDYCAFFKAMANWTDSAGFPFGDRVTVNSQGKKSHDLNLGDGSRSSFQASQRRHDRWRTKREESSGYADAEHAFRHQGSGKAYTYKMFLEQAHALLADGSRLGLIVPSGLYSDFGTGALRRLFLDHCRWEWIFGFENREKVFDIDSRFKFNPVIIAKGGETAAIRTAFMRRNLADWERAEQFATPYSREQVTQFSPNSLAILEIQSARDLEVLTKIYANSVLLGDQCPEGWGIQYAQGDFNMTSDSKLFPPRPKWEEWGYRPDEYSRWINGPWRPVEELYAELGVEPLPDGQRRCAQPPYDKLPLPRADIPAGIILSREATHYIREDEIPEVTFTDASGRPLKIKTEDQDGNKVQIEPTGPAIALPLYEGRMIGQFDFSQKGWVSGKGRGAVWREIPWEQKLVDPQFLMGQGVYYVLPIENRRLKAGIMDVTSATNTRTMISVPLGAAPTCHKVPTLNPTDPVRAVLPLSGLLNSLVFDFVLRNRFGGLSLIWAALAETALPARGSAAPSLGALACRLTQTQALALPALQVVWSQGHSDGSHPRLRAALTAHERLRTRASLEAVAAASLQVVAEDLAHILAGCDLPQAALQGQGSQKLNPKGFWRVDKDKPPEHRHTVLSLVAFHDLQEKTDACGGDVAVGIEAFCNQNDGEGWMLPETLRLADYGLGHDDRAKQPQPVRECFGPRFYDWQLAQTPEESWRECHLHARNLLGEAGYQALLAEIEGREAPAPREQPSAAKPGPAASPPGMLFDPAEQTPLFDRRSHNE